MEISDIFLTLIGLIIAMLGWFMSRLADKVSRLDDTLNSCQSTMPLNYVLKDDYKTDISEFKEQLSSQSKKIDQIWKSIRVKE